jgi:N-acyl-D-aspartate/D-glutamate deacylase
VASSVFRTAAARDQLLLLVGDEPDRDWLTGIENVDELLERGALRLTSVDDAYAHRDDPAAQLAQFEATLDQALSDGYAGLTVVADNSRMLEGGQEDFEAWLAWEAAADQLQATRPVLGVCYFDLDRVPAERLIELAAVHPLRCDGFPTPTFQVFCDEERLRVVGELEALYADQVRRVVGSVVSVTGRELDLSELEFIDHNTLLMLDEIARSGAAVRLRGARDIVRRIWALLDVPTPALELS